MPRSGQNHFSRLVSRTSRPSTERSACEPVVGMRKPRDGGLPWSGRIALTLRRGRARLEGAMSDTRHSRSENESGRARKGKRPLRREEWALARRPGLRGGGSRAASLFLAVPEGRRVPAAAFQEALARPTVKSGWDQ